MTNAYGPQEYDGVDKKVNFWSFLDTEVSECHQSGLGCMIFMDANSWLGSDYIKNDPHKQNKNGELFASFLSRNQNINVLNASNLCEGLITRQRSVDGRSERSVIDFVLVCNKVLPFAKKMVIDEDKIYSLSNFNSKKQLLVHSDHNSLITEFNFKMVQQKIDRRLIFQFKDQNALDIFKKRTTLTRKLTNCFINKNLPFEKQCKKWFKEMQHLINECFMKVRVRPKKLKSCTIFKKRKMAIKNGQKRDQFEYESQLKKEQAQLNMNRIQSNLSKLEESGSKQHNIWKVKNKFHPKIKPTLPVAKKNLSGKIVTNPEELKNVYIDHFVHRMRSRPIKPGMEQYQSEVEKRFHEILEVTKNVKFPDWSLQDLSKVPKSL